jgi:hypothetical protein
MESQVNKIKIKNDYNEYTGPRYCNQGAASGEDFYHTMLNDAFSLVYREGKMLEIDLDDTAGYLSSFLDEAFGNLIFDFTVEIVKPRIKIISTQEPDWEAMIINDVFQDWENRRVSNNFPKKTEKHQEWFRYVNGQLTKNVWIQQQ